jgi:DtxR family transcriptional regulator, Mn-dependent transcriptional regulator
MPHFANHSEENYLKTLFALSNREIKKLNNITLAKTLELNPATVLEMVRKLAAKNLVEIKADKTILLTEKGKKKALLTIRKHRLWEVFLVEKLQYKWNEVHELAEQMEHIESDDLIDRLELFLGYPDFDPHGDPIPDKKGRLKVNASIPLSLCQKGKAYKVVGLAETNDAFLDYLGKLNIMPGVKLKFVEQHVYDNSFSVLVQKKPVQLSEKVANNILVQPG